MWLTIVGSNGVVDTVMNIETPYNTGNLLASWRSTVFQRPLLHRVNYVIIQLIKCFCMLRHCLVWEN